VTSDPQIQIARPGRHFTLALRWCHRTGLGGAIPSG